MVEKCTAEEIKDYWTQQARRHGPTAAASWSDIEAINLEIAAIATHLEDGDRVLDVGCANGYSTVQYALRKRVTIRGVDYVDAMIDEARRRQATVAPLLLGSAEFDRGNATALREESAAYDKVIVVRVLINLGDWENQRRALAECARVLKPGGLLLLSEATLQGWNKLNQFRAEWRLEPIPMPPFNTYLDEEQVAAAGHPDLELCEIANFSSTYFVATRVIKPLLARAADAGIDVANPLMEWNRWAAQLPAWGDYGTQKLFVFKKR